MLELQRRSRPAGYNEPRNNAGKSKRHAAAQQAVNPFSPWPRAGGPRTIKCGLYSDPHFA